MKFKAHIERLKKVSRHNKIYYRQKTRRYKVHPKIELLSLLKEYGYENKTKNKQYLRYIQHAAAKWYAHTILNDYRKTAITKIERDPKTRHTVLYHWLLYHNLNPHVVFPYINLLPNINQRTFLVSVGALPIFNKYSIRPLSGEYSTVELVYRNRELGYGLQKSKFRGRHTDRIANILSEKGFYKVDFARVERTQSVYIPMHSERYYLEWNELQNNGGYKEGDVLQRIDLTWQRGLLGTFLVARKYRTKSGYRYILQSIRYGTIYRHPFTERELCHHGYFLLGKTTMEHRALLANYWQDPERVNYLPPEEYFIPTGRGKVEHVRKRLRLQKKLNRKTLEQLDLWIV